MKRDYFGICITRAMLLENIKSTFTHVRAYEKNTLEPLDLKVLLAFPQMSGHELLNTMQGSHQLIWRASHHCPSFS
ncbi:hypothetical protein BCU68_11455 [Vibrio sp. 10N.286.49.B3]|uniref:hypothetical protein n=1 Tax=Vibrio sp. 10N.286.49.B3 TaxID=1880855 RepID=UPI000C81B3B0|nr:hypothetical protein [Vibrio sp. 10N.286.49.B3]PMH44917.1 hypothetical protein BCU68_11455 [Vibrio sp. 10N.286.49.B3]